MRVKRCRQTSTVGGLVGVVAHEVAHEVSGMTFKQLITGNDHDQIWNDILKEIYRRMGLLQIPHSECFTGLNLAVKNHD
uniref:Uncharacterized protein n=1 Tax=Panagrolaimus superbus TaxID=310955 RepID=A0A914Z8X1_9BILA